ncbi:MAG: SRPBCC family protein [Haloarculaceae archaeon]
MDTFERQTRVAAPLDAIWEFHATVDGLRALTPPWMHLRVESVTGPDGERDVSELVSGTTIEMSVRPFDVGPRQSWTARIGARERGDGAAYFRDEMLDGPFRRWVHTHSFFADGAETLLRDSVEYETPLGSPGDAVAPAFLGPFFRYRHRRTRSLLEA